MRLITVLGTATVGLGLSMAAQAGTFAPTPAEQPVSAGHGAILVAASAFQVSCQVDASASITHIYLRNSGSQAIAGGTRIMWGAQPGSHGGVALVGPTGLPPGEWLYVGGYVGVRNCTASVVD